MPAPSLFDSPVAATPAAPVPAGNAAPTAPASPRNLSDLLYEGFFVIFLLNDGYSPTDGASFRKRINAFLDAFERDARRMLNSAEDIHLAKFAICSLIDETVLSSSLAIREEWRRQPLQLELFGEQLAGERFFLHLDQLREGSATRVQVLEVFHMCLLLGFQGRYILEGSEKLSYLTSRVGEDIARMNGRRPAFAPHWAAPDRVTHALRGELPLWVAGLVFLLLALLAYVGIRTGLERQTQADLADYAEVVKLAPPAAHLTITLP